MSLLGAIAIAARRRLLSFVGERLMGKHGRRKGGGLGVAAEGGVQKQNGGKRGGAGRAPGIEFDKQQGQHVLRNPGLAETIVDKADVRQGDTVLEVGPGTGNLTLRLLEAARRVIAVENDGRLVTELRRRVQGTEMERKLTVVHGDVMEMDLPGFDLCVANIPYQISSPLVFKLLLHRPPFRAAVIMFQREFAMRLVSQPGDSLYCRLAANVHLLAKPSHLLKVSRNSFRPPPKVDSSVVMIEPRSPPPPVDFQEWDGLVRLCFNRKNKTLGSIFRQKATLDVLRSNARVARALSGGMEDAMGSPEEERDQVKGEALSLLQSLGLESARAAKMSQNDFLRLLSAFNERGIHFA